MISLKAHALLAFTFAATLAHGLGERVQQNNIETRGDCYGYTDAAACLQGRYHECQSPMAINCIGQIDGQCQSACS
ncbi:hypothetical protein GGR57DRAFT_474267 [Xylariaceae sp. FL1272]|nr:hypothetical protein GGR57DRAFT_474267 [Xylariaceae sp. FL1272]